MPSTPANSKDQRRHERKPVHADIQVFDLVSGQLLGRLVNLSESGFMLMGQTRIPKDRLYQLRLHSDASAQESDLLIGAESLWTQDAEEEGAYWSGFHIIDMREDVPDRLRDLLASL